VKEEKSGGVTEGKGKGEGGDDVAGLLVKDRRNFIVEERSETVGKEYLGWMMVMGKRICSLRVSLQFVRDAWGYQMMKKRGWSSGASWQQG